MRGKTRSRLLRGTKVLKPIELLETHVCPTVEEDEDGELVYRVTGC